MALELVVLALVIAVAGLVFWRLRQHQVATPPAVTSTAPTSAVSTADADQDLSQAQSSLDTLSSDLSTVDKTSSDKEGDLSTP